MDIVAGPTQIHRKGGRILKDVGQVVLVQEQPQVQMARPESVDRRGGTIMALCVSSAPCLASKTIGFLQQGDPDATACQDQGSGETRRAAPYHHHVATGACPGCLPARGSRGCQSCEKASSPQGCPTFSCTGIRTAP
jgi:hypothetical protein